MLNLLKMEIVKNNIIYMNDINNYNKLKLNQLMKKKFKIYLLK